MRRKWSIKYMIFGDPPKAEIDLIAGDGRFESVIYSHGILSFIGSEDDVSNLLEQLPNWRIVVDGKFNLSCQYLAE